jgi:simple sugar transport system ATP-binding protein
LTNDTTAPAIELKGISKAFGPVQANKDISIRVMPGTIHGIIGENGAGKSTLMSILYGFYKADKGEIFIGGQKTEIPDSQAAIAAGIGMVFGSFLTGGAIGMGVGFIIMGGLIAKG